MFDRYERIKSIIVRNCKIFTYASYSQILKSHLYNVD